MKPEISEEAFGNLDATWPDRLEMKNANKADLPQVSWHGWTNLIHSFACRFLSSPLWLCQSSYPCHSVFPRFLICSSPSRLAAERGGDGIGSLSASSGRAWRGSAFSRGVKQRVIRSRSWRTSCKSACPRSHTPLLRKYDATCQFSHYWKRKG